jgi:hypothetical protein
LDLFPKLLQLAADYQQARDIAESLETDYSEIGQDLDFNYTDLHPEKESAYEFLDASLQSKDVHFLNPPSVRSSHHGLSSVKIRGQCPQSQYNNTQDHVRSQTIKSVREGSSLSNSTLDGASIDHLQPFLSQSSTSRQSHPSESHCLTLGTTPRFFLITPL